MPNGEVYFFEESFERDGQSHNERSLGKKLIGTSSKHSPNIIAACNYQGLAKGELLKLVPADNEQGFALVGMSQNSPSYPSSRPDFFNEDEIYDDDEISDDGDFNHNVIYRSNRHYSPLGADTRGGAHFYRPQRDMSLQGNCLMEGAKHNNNQALASQAFAKKNSSLPSKAAFKDFYTPKDSTNASFVSARQINTNPTKFKTIPASAYGTFSDNTNIVLGANHSIKAPIAACAHNPAVKRAPVISSEQNAQAERAFQESMNNSALSHLQLPRPTAHLEQRHDYIPTPSAQEFADYHAPYHQAFSHNNSVSHYSYGAEYADQEREVVYNTHKYEQALRLEQRAANEDNFTRVSNVDAHFSKVPSTPSDQQWWRDVSYTRRSAKKAFDFDTFKQTKRGSFIGTPEEFLPQAFEESPKVKPNTTSNYQVSQLDSSDATFISSSTLKDEVIVTPVAPIAPVEENKVEVKRTPILVLTGNSDDTPKEGVTKITTSDVSELPVKERTNFADFKTASDLKDERILSATSKQETATADDSAALEQDTTDNKAELKGQSPDEPTINNEVTTKILSSDSNNFSDFTTANGTQSQVFYRVPVLSQKQLQAQRAQEQAEKERLAAERLAKEKAEQERLEAERLAKEKAEQERREAERLAKEKAEQERREAERLAKEKAEQERREAERLAKEKAERLAKEKAEQERREAERLAKEKAEQERREAERLAKEKAEQERREAERLAKEKAEQERRDAERLAKEKAEQERREAERLAKEKAEQERIAAEEAEIMRDLEEEQAQLEAQKKAQEAQEAALRAEQSHNTAEAAAPTSTRSKRKKRNKHKNTQVQEQTINTVTEAAPTPAVAEAAPSAAVAENDNKPMSKSQARRAKQKAKAMARAATQESNAPITEKQTPVTTKEDSSSKIKEADDNARSMANGLLNTTNFFGSGMNNQPTMIKAIYTHHSFDDLNHQESPESESAYGKQEPALTTVPVLDSDDEFIQEPHLGFEISKVSDYGKEPELSNVADVANIQDEEEPDFKGNIMDAVAVDSVADKEVIFATPTRFAEQEGQEEPDAITKSSFMSEAKLTSSTQNLSEQTLQEGLEGFKPLSNQMEATQQDNEELLNDNFMSDDTSLEYLHTSSNHEGGKSKSSNSLANLAAELIDDFDDPFEDSFAQSLNENQKK